MTHLLACQACGRHVRAFEAQCPFCSAPRVVARAPRAAPAERVGRASLYAFGVGAVSLAVSVGACQHEGSDAMATVYGGPPDLQAPADGGADAAAPRKAPTSPPVR